MQEFKKISEAFLFIRNGKSVKQNSEASGVPITRIETIANRSIDANRLGYANIDFDDMGKFEDYLLKSGDILMSHINSPKHLGKTAVYNELPANLIHGMNLLCLRTDKEICNSNYANYFFQSNYFLQDLSAISNKSVNQASFSVGRLKDLKIPLPPLKTQQRIAGILDDAAALRDKTAQLLTEYDLLAQSIFLEMFGDPVLNPKSWAKLSLEEFCEFENGDRSSNYPSGNDIKKVGKLFLSSGDIKNGRFIVKDSKFISQEKFNSLKRGKCFTNDILMTLRGNGTGKTALFDCEFPEGFINAQMVIIRPNEKCQSKYLVFQLNCPPIFKRLINLNSGSAQPQLSASSVKKFEVFVPPIELQNEFADKIALIEQQKALAKQELQESEDLFNCLLQQAFKGELV